MRLWWLADTARVGAEKRAVEALVAGEGWFDPVRWAFHEGNLCVEGDILVDGDRRPVRLVYPDQFPDVPAWVEPREPGRWSPHQYGDRDLCLQLRPDNWTPEATGADMLRSARDLLVVESAPGGVSPAPSDHRVGGVQAYDWVALPILIGAGCLARLQAGTADGVRALRWMTADETWPILVFDALDGSGPAPPPGADARAWRVELSVSVHNGPIPSSASDATALFRAAGMDPADAAVMAARSSVVVFRDDAAVGAFHLTGDGAAHFRRVHPIADDAGSRSGRGTAAAPGRVAVVGAGSVGSKLAEGLVRSGVRAINLVDGDIMLPANLERHALDWGDVGARKVHGLRRRLLAIAPGAEVVAVDQNLDWQRSARTHARQVGWVADCNVIVDATGDPATGLFLGAVAEANGRPFVSVELFEGGIGALVATCLPGRDPPFAVARASFLAWCDERGTRPPDPGLRDYEALSADGAALVADDAAASMTAAHAARVVLDVLDGRPAPIEAAWLLLGYAVGWLFDGHGHTIRLCVGGGVEAGRAADEDTDARDFVMALVREHLGEGQAVG